MTGTLYLCATPIGNLEDITLRALRVLREVDLIVAEDTRHTAELLRHYGIKARFGPSLYEGVERERIPLILRELRAGKRVALVSDAGTPLISDPGYPLVRACVEEGIPVVPIPGPAAFLAALVASGLPTDSFVFLGALPRRKGRKEEALERLVVETRTAVMYESPHRLLETLEIMAELYPDRPLVLARELTKVHEEFVRGSVEGVLKEIRERGGVRGEVVLVLGGAPSPLPGSLRKDLIDFYEFLIREKGMDPEEALQEISEISSLPRRELQRILKRKKGGIDDC